jgi:hypothetical protein
MTEQLGETISRFVEERIGGPQNDEEMDFWCELVYAALFSVAFDVLIRLSTVKGSADKLEHETNVICHATAEHASSWVSSRLSQCGSDSGGPRITWSNLSPEIRARMLTYFREAFIAWGDRGYDREVARSHSCYAVLSGVTRSLAARHPNLSPDMLIALDQKLRNGFECCERMSREIADLLDRKDAPRVHEGARGAKRGTVRMWIDRFLSRR